MAVQNDEFGFLVAKFSSNKIVVYKERFNKFASQHQQLQAKINFEKKEYNGYMSPATRRYVTKVLDTWFLAVKHYNSHHSTSSSWSKKKLTFVTLTLPATQQHTDNEVKRNMLNVFITKCVRLGFFTHYFWRAESQLNGNIHFHLIVDKYLNIKALQSMWINVLSPFGYIDSFEMLHGHRTPPCTHVAVIPPNCSIVDYVTKYVGKNGEGRKIGGRIWGMSDKLRDMLTASDVLDTEIEAKISKFVTDDQKNVYISDNCYVVTIPFADRLRYELEFRKRVFFPFQRANCNYLYFDGDLPLNVLFPKLKNVISHPAVSPAVKPKQFEMSFF